MVFFRALAASSISFIDEPTLLILPDFTYHFVIEVLDDVKVIKYRLDVTALFFKRFLEIRVHVTGDGLNVVHPLFSDMIDEVIDHLLFLAVGDPENMTGFEIDDVCGIPVAVVQLELIYTQDSRCLLRLDELFSIDGIPVLQTFLIDCLDGILTKTGNLGYLLQSVSTGSQKDHVYTDKAA